MSRCQSGSCAFQGSSCPVSGEWGVGLGELEGQGFKSVVFTCGVAENEIMVERSMIQDSGGSGDLVV
jgi:hypothetical protein